MSPLHVRVARRFVAGLGDQLDAKMEALLGGPLDVGKGKELAEWMEANFHFLGAKTPRGGKTIKEDVNRLHWWLKAGLGQHRDLEGIRPTLEDAWGKVKAHLDEVVRLLSDEGGKVVPKEIRVGANTYRNISGFSEGQLTVFIKALEQVFDELKGWRKKALAGGVVVALAGPKEFRGTAAGSYRSGEDTLYVRVTPKILTRTRGSYGAFDYIIVHELGHRYEYKFHPREDFDKSHWLTSKYSSKEGEAFAELFAISNFGIKGPWDQARVDRFEEYMSTGKVPETEPRELPPHLKQLLGK